MTKTEGLSRASGRSSERRTWSWPRPGWSLSSPVMAVAWLAATVDTRQNGLFRQRRVGLGGTTFDVLKIRSTWRRGHHGDGVDDVRITRLGSVLRGQDRRAPSVDQCDPWKMSLVGPRPDVPGFADALSGADRIVLSVRPGITSPAALAFRHEERLLASVAVQGLQSRRDLAGKVRINREYVENWSLLSDLRCWSAPSPRPPGHPPWKRPPRESPPRATADVAP